MPVQTQIQTRRGTAASWTSTNPTLAAGEIGFESDTGKFKIGNGSTAWAALAYAGGATAVTYVFNATAGQTTFSGADANSLTLAYTVGAEQVYLNGVLLVRGSDYTATNGTSIVLASGALASDVLNVIAFSAMTITDTYTQAQANATFPLNTSSFFAGKNKIINGDFGVWQRGTSFSNPSDSTFFADRWLCTRGATSGTTTVSRQTFTTGTAPISSSSSQYYLNWNQSVAGSDGFRTLNQRIEGVGTFAGQTVTLSFWARLNSGTFTNPALTIRQGFGTGGSPSSIVDTSVTTSFVFTSSWQRFTQTFTLPSISGKTIGTNGNDSLELIMFLPPASTFNFDIWGVQVEAGSVATAFQTATGTIQGELAACQRYYFRITPPTTSYHRLGMGQCGGTTTAQVTTTFPVPMRTSPTALEQNGVGSDYALTNSTNGAVNCNAVPTFDLASNFMATTTFTVASGLTAGNATQGLKTSGAASYLGWSAEL